MLQIMKSDNNHGKVKRIKQYNRCHILHLSEDIASVRQVLFFADNHSYSSTGNSEASEDIAIVVLGTVSVRQAATEREGFNKIFACSIPTKNVKQEVCRVF